MPYFKTNYNAMAVSGTYNTMGQHAAAYAGDRLLRGGRLPDWLAVSCTASGGFRDEADEGAHPFDLRYPRGLGCVSGNVQRWGARRARRS